MACAVSMRRVVAESMRTVSESGAQLAAIPQTGLRDQIAAAEA